ncbi:DNA-binding transcriptional regulator, AcrR family [Nakamurella panacisegetis]|uniref:DNA-binding transcriptional regulator, AcrR family n=1 Tax=Nakamurella panacisegetis TaxID=1090615 RepID=A0A1H0KK88_9ACTN|nr:TetR/AcrR family transcriptional regulator [Nakamurella panacisegetis]SDO56305.1 DNA-binding transcriptional regulator, AcrR family [Nakamurella panacisegetis]
MTQVLQADREPLARRHRVDKFAQRRDQLAQSALLTLSELGYARTSLREIAQNSTFSHGVLHYYFTDKVELILHCVRRYKTECVTQYDQIVATSTTPDELATGFGAAMAATLRSDAHLHRLWYDMRSQSLFEESFRTDVLELDRGLEQMIWRIVTRYADLAGRPLAVTPAVAYALFDGLFQQALLHHLGGDAQAAAELQTTVQNVLVGLVLAPR